MRTKAEIQARIERLNADLKTGAYLLWASTYRVCGELAILQEDAGPLPKDQAEAQMQQRTLSPSDDLNEVYAWLRGDLVYLTDAESADRDICDDCGYRVADYYIPVELGDELRLCRHCNEHGGAV
ncbi:hypothetical protein [Oceanospirillum maris]|uniref:hypothetical protein n=1 Tax=Oceanospirillum maris TaxID=64977 RepID=UPI00040DBE79|nr:hypothetical protein [Oceanospirillum maris]